MTDQQRNESKEPGARVRAELSPAPFIFELVTLEGAKHPNSSLVSTSQMISRQRGAAADEKPTVKTL